MIDNYYTEAVTVSKKTETVVNGVVKETTATVWSGNVAFDKSTTNRLFSSDKETYELAAVAYAPIASGITENDILTYNSVDYTVVSAIDPMKRGHHLEVALEKRD